MFIHYGSSAFGRKKFVPVSNRRYSTKPFGGIWASAEDSKFGWKQWNEREECAVCSDDNAFRFTLAPWARVKKIRSREDLADLPLADSESLWGIREEIHPDFEALSQMYDAIDVIVSNGNGVSRALYGWDCDSILVMNPEAVIPEKEEE